jgi:ATP-dependent DNA ligase
MENKTTFPTLYKYTTTGKIQEWTICVKGNAFWTIEGIKDGKLTTSEPTICEGKNVGRANETTAEEQAIKEAQSKHQHKLDKGYNEVLTHEKKFFEPMLAQKYEKYADLCFKKATFIQPKLDGLRCINEAGTMTSRNGKPYVSVPHLTQSHALLDGELYSHEYKSDFNKIVSLCKKTKPTPEDIEESERMIEFWAYDLPDHKGVFSERYKELHRVVENLGNSKIKIVPTYIERYHTQFLEEGYEGSIVRIDLGDYENKRSKQLLKKKDFFDGEFEIVNFEEGKGNRSGTAGNVILKLKDGRTFGAGIKGTREFVRDIFLKKDSLIGKTATIKYFQETPDGIPRFGVATQIDRFGYE